MQQSVTCQLLAKALWEIHFQVQFQEPAGVRLRSSGNGSKGKRAPGCPYWVLFTAKMQPTAK